MPDPDFARGRRGLPFVIAADEVPVDLFERVEAYAERSHELVQVLENALEARRRERPAQLVGPVHLEMDLDHLTMLYAVVCEWQAAFEILWDELAGLHDDFIQQQQEIEGVRQDLQRLREARIHDATTMHGLWNDLRICRERLERCRERKER